MSPADTNPPVLPERIVSEPHCDPITPATGPLFLYDYAYYKAVGDTFFADDQEHTHALEFVTLPTTGRAAPEAIYVVDGNQGALPPRPEYVVVDVVAESDIRFANEGQPAVVPVKKWSAPLPRAAFLALQDVWHAVIAGARYSSNVSSGMERYFGMPMLEAGGSWGAATVEDPHPGSCGFDLVAVMARLGAYARAAPTDREGILKDLLIRVRNVQTRMVSAHSPNLER